MGWKIECARHAPPCIGARHRSSPGGPSSRAPAHARLLAAARAPLWSSRFTKRPISAIPAVTALLAITPPSRFENTKAQGAAAARSGWRRRCRGRRECALDACWLGGLRRARSVVQRGILSQAGAPRARVHLVSSSLRAPPHGTRPGPKGGPGRPAWDGAGRAGPMWTRAHFGGAPGLHSSSGPVRRSGGGEGVPFRRRRAPVQCHPRVFLSSSVVSWAPPNPRVTSAACPSVRTTLPPARPPLLILPPIAAREGGGESCEGGR
jgi:hypothetical protein